ncbi:MAG TPA: retropepsin-like aspartic protease [Candidatus Elarobacter sp.]|nr:retropepsin-like aspartic protease [Candidatus Elarobacter sp.]
MRPRALVTVATVGLCVALPTAAGADWRPPELRPAATTLAAVLAANAAATGTAAPRYANRYERWTYRAGARTLPVRVAVRGGDFRATVTVGAAEYAGGRTAGTRWRADADGVAHATWSDDQGDAIDRLPQSIFPFDRADCALAGESTRFGPAWVIVDRPPGDKPHWFYVDESTGLIAHEITREGKRAVVTSFTAFETVDGVRRPSRWRVTDGDSANDLDVAVDDVAPQPVAERDVAVPQTQRLFVPSSPVASGIVRLPATFDRERIYVDVVLDGRHGRFVLDTGTSSIIVNPARVARQPSGIVLEHAIVPEMSVGDLSLANVSVLTVPLSIDRIDGLLGYDFFVGHVLHIDYAGQRVEMMTPQAAASAFTDPRSIVIPASFDEGIPLVHAAFGPASGDRFALDSGSQSLFAMTSFARRNAAEIAAHWSPAKFRSGRPTETVEYLEGPIAFSARQVSTFTFGLGIFHDQIVGIEVPDERRGTIEIPLDGIIGTDHMAVYDWWFDYDGGRIAVRRNGR